MNCMPKNAEEILSRYIFGFHMYILTPKARLRYVSHSFCELVGEAESDFSQGDIEAYTRLIHPDDRKSFADFLRE